eukprot:scaffold43267_cov63-Phaeocystis_antarctica.AAC.2
MAGSPPVAVARWPCSETVSRCRCMEHSQHAFDAPRPPLTCMTGLDLQVRDRDEGREVRVRREVQGREELRHAGLQHGACARAPAC